MKQRALNMYVKVVRLNYLYFTQTSLSSTYDFQPYTKTNSRHCKMVKSLIPKRLLVKETDHFPIACKYMKYDCSLNLNNGFSIIRIFALCMFSIVAEHENLNVHHILSSKAMQKMPHFVAMLQVVSDPEENSCMAVTGAHKSSNVETCDTWSCDMGGLAKILLATLHFPLHKVGKENETAYLHSYLNASNCYCLHITPMILGCCPKHSCKKSQKTQKNQSLQ